MGRDHFESALNDTVSAARDIIQVLRSVLSGNREPQVRTPLAAVFTVGFRHSAENTVSRFPTCHPERRIARIPHSFGPHKLLRWKMGNERQPRDSIRVLLAEANYLNCQLVERALRSRRIGVSVIACAVGSDDALASIKEHEPEVAVISAQLQEGPLEGYRVLREIRSLQSRTRAIMLLSSREREFVIDAFRCGAHGVLFRDEPLEILAKCIHAVHRGQVWANSLHLTYVLDALRQAMPLRLRDARGIQLLSKRELEVARLVAEGLTNRAIAIELRLSEHTIRNYLFRIFDKLGVSTRVELVLYCLQERQKAFTGGTG